MHAPAPPPRPATRHVHFSLPLVNLTAALIHIPDPRRRQGTRDPLPAILTLAVAAILCNHRSLLTIVDWKSDHVGCSEPMPHGGAALPERRWLSL